MNEQNVNGRYIQVVHSSIWYFVFYEIRFFFLGPTNTSDNSDNIGYHTTPYGEPRPNSETSQSNSDEWVEVSDSESEHTVYV